MNNTYLTTQQVFGVSNEPVKSYIERLSVDALFITGLRSRKHIVVYGASKQGKTALVTRHIPEGGCVHVECGSTSKPSDLYRSVLRQIGVEFVEHREVSLSSTAGGTVSYKAKVKVPFLPLEAGPDGQADKAAGNFDNTTYRTVDYDLALAQDVAELFLKALNGRRIVLENFHYLPESIQQSLAIDLRIFEDMNILFIILGIWRERNRLTQFNGDLVDRLIEVPVEPWTKEDLTLVVQKGERLLNVSFDPILPQLIDASFDSIGVLQELCKHAAISAGVERENVGRTLLISISNLKEAIARKLTDYRNRHERCLETLIDQKNKTSQDIPLYYGYYFVKMILSNSVSDIIAGAHRREIETFVKANHHDPNRIRSSDTSNFLHKLVHNQIEKGIRPPIFDYDQTNRTMRIIDSTFYFFLKNIDRDELLKEIGIPEGLDNRQFRIDSTNPELGSTF